MSLAYLRAFQVFDLSQLLPVCGGFPHRIVAGASRHRAVQRIPKELFRRPRARLYFCADKPLNGLQFSRQRTLRYWCSKRPATCSTRHAPKGSDAWWQRHSHRCGACNSSRNQPFPVSRTAGSKEPHAVINSPLNLSLTLGLACIAQRGLGPFWAFSQCWAVSRSAGSPSVSKRS